MYRITERDFYQRYEKVSVRESGQYTPPVDVNIILTLICHFKPKRFVEFGVQEGITAKIILDKCPSIEKYAGIDVPFGFETVMKVQQPEVPKVAGSLVSDDRFEALVLPKGTIELDVENLEPADMVFIDADHSTKGVQRDTELALQIIESGVIIWHDYNRAHVQRYVNRRPGAISVSTSEKSPGVAFEVLQGSLPIL
jgi:predicted O-methyltransferase YrrM